MPSRYLSTTGCIWTHPTFQCIGRAPVRGCSSNGRLGLTPPNTGPPTGAILGAIRDHRAARVLIDARDAKVISEEDQQWLDADWIPRAVTAGRRWTAVVMPSSALVRSIVENIDKRPADSRVEARYFDTADDARAWLSEVR